MTSVFAFDCCNSCFERDVIYRSLLRFSFSQSTIQAIFYFSMPSHAISFTFLSLSIRMKMRIDMV